MTAAAEPSSCRFCSSHRGPTASLFESASFADLTLAEAVSELAGIGLDLEHGSQEICRDDCLVRLEDCFRFRERVAQAESELQQHFEDDADVKLEIIEEDEDQYDEEEFLEDGPQVGKFVMPPEALIVTYLEFEHFNYVEFRGERCCGCELICVSEDELREHARYCHPSSVKGGSKFGCAVCGIEFASLEELTKHKECYSIKELLVCKLCQLIFVSKEALMLHMEESSVHQSTVEDGAAELVEDEDVVEPPPAEGLDIEIEFNNTELESFNLKLPEEQLVASFEDFDQHRIITVVDSAERCCVCGVFFQSLKHLMDHARREHHADKKPIDGKAFCDVCLETYRSLASLNTHKTMCRYVKKLFFCKLCQLVYTRKFQIVKHFKSTPNHTSNIAKDKESSRSKKSGFACCFLRCSSVFDQEQQLMAHVEEQHAPRRVINLSERTSEEFVCSICQRNFSSQQLLLLHRNRTLKKKHICSYCGEPFLIPSKLREHEQLVHTESIPQHPCNTCGKTFRTPNLLKAHEATHNESRNFACDQCPARFKFRFQLRKHLNGVHPTSFPYECTFCDKKFSVKAKHDLHVRSHTGSKPYTCRFESCGKQFSHVTDRKRHEMGLHTGERPYRCEHCLAGFVRKRELLIHGQKHQSQGQEV